MATVWLMMLGGFLCASAITVLASKLALRLPLYRLRPNQQEKPEASGQTNWFRVVLSGVAIVVAATLLLKFWSSAAVTPNFMFYMIFFIIMTSVSATLRGEFGMIKPVRALVASVALSAMAYWVFSPNWLSASLLGIVIVLSIVYGVEYTTRITCVPFWSMAIVLLILAFGYDMIQVFATKNMQSGMQNVIGEWMPMMIYIPQSLSLDAPVGMILGLGDIAFPAMLVVVAGRAAQRVGVPQLYRAAVAGYMLGLMLAGVTLVLFSVGQPVLIFVVPMITLFVWLSARKHGVAPILLQKLMSTP